MQTDWSCPRCQKPLGRLSQNGDLHIGRSVRAVEFNANSVTVSCRCGGCRLFFDGRIIGRSGRVLGKR